MWKKNIYVTTLALIVALTGCQKTNEGTMRSLKIDLQEGDLPSLHPHSLMIYLRGISIAKTLYECLSRINIQGKVELAGAKSVDISSDRLRYTFELRENHWSNGTPVTAYQYEHAWKEALSPTSTCTRADLLYMIKNAKEAKKGEVPLDAIGVKALDHKTLVVELAYPSPYFLELAAQPLCAPLVDPKEKEPSLFNGPFLVDSWKKNDLLKLKPNPHFWNHKKIALKEIDVFMIQDMMTAYSLHEKGTLDWIGAPLCPLSTELIEHLKKEHLLRSHPVARAFWVFLNTQHPALASSSIRQALGLAIDRSSITKHIFIGGHPLNKPFPSELIPIPAQFPIKENRVEAQKKFKQGLQELNLTEEDFPPLVITYSQQANRKQLAEHLQELWSTVFGIDVQLQSQEWNVLRSNLGKGLFEISGSFEVPFYKDPLEVLERFTSINSGNFSQWLCPLFEEKVSLARQEKNPQTRMQFLAEAEQILINEAPFIPICSDELLFAHSSNLHGYTFDYVGAIDFSYASFDQ